MRVSVALSGSLRLFPPPPPLSFASSGGQRPVATHRTTKTSAGLCTTYTRLPWDTSISRQSNVAPAWARPVKTKSEGTNKSSALWGGTKKNRAGGLFTCLETSKSNSYVVRLTAFFRFCFPPAQKSRGARPLLVAHVRYDDADIYPGESGSRVYSEREQQRPALPRHFGEHMEHLVLFPPDTSVSACAPHCPS